MIKGKVLGTDIDINGNIQVQVEYTLTDGTKIVKPTKYNFINFSRDAIAADIKKHCEVLMRKVYTLKRHTEIINEIAIADIEHECTSVEIVLKSEVKDPETGEIITPKETVIATDK